MKKQNLHFRFATEEDTDLYYQWANDELVRENSFSSKEITYTEHVNWFHQKLVSKAYFFYLFLTEQNQPVGQVRIVKGKETIIGISIDKNFRGKSLGTEMLLIACEHFLSNNENEKIVAYIKVNNSASYNVFKKAGFCDIEIVDEQGYKSYKLFKKQ